MDQVFRKRIIAQKILEKKMNLYSFHTDLEKEQGITGISVKYVKVCDMGGKL